MLFKMNYNSQYAKYSTRSFSSVGNEYKVMSQVVASSQSNTRCILKKP